MRNIDKENIENILALTPMQEGMLFHYLKEPERDYYFEQLSLEISGEINTEIFEKAWNFVIESNEMLRTAFRWEKVDNPVQIILKGHQFQPRYYDFPGKVASDVQNQVEEIKVKDREQKFDLREVPFRVNLCKTDENKYEMIISNHHILYDGWSNGIILKEFFNAYNDLYSGKELAKPVKSGFKEFIQYIQKLDVDTQEKFWKYYLSGFETQTELSVKRVKEIGITSTGEGEYQKYRIHFEKDLYANLEGFIKKHKITLASLLYSIWGLLLQKYNNTGDVIFGITVSGRGANVPGIEDMVGLFINTIPLRVRTFPDEKIGDWLYRMDNILKMKGKYEHTSLVKIKEYSEVVHREELFDTIVVMENYPLDIRLKLKNNKLSVDSYSMVEKSHYDLIAAITVFDDVKITFTYNRQVYDEDTIRRLAAHFRCITGNIVQNPGNRVTGIEMISEEEKRQLLVEFNDSKGGAQFPKDKGIHALFAEQAERTPNHPAVTFNLDLSPIYEELKSTGINPGLIDDLEKCCFKKNPYIFQFQSQEMLEALDIFDKSEQRELIMLMTHKRNYVAVNEPVILLLDYFTGRETVKSLLNGTAGKKQEFLIYTIEKGEDTDFLPGFKNRFAVNGDIGCNSSGEDMILLIKALNYSHLIELVDYRSEAEKLTFQPDIDLTPGFKTKPRRIIKADKSVNDRRKFGAPVLLLGDRTGQGTTGLLYIASFLRRNGIEAYCQWNDTNTTISSLKKNIEMLLAKIQPKVVGVSMKWFPHIARVLKICQLVKEYDSAIKIVIGGNTASYYKEEIIQYEWVDYVVLGDGEVPFLEICLGKDDIPNCVYKKNGTIVETAITYVQDEKNSSEIYLSHLDEIFVSKKDPYLAPYFYIFTGKGCLMECLYCAGCKETQKKIFNRDKPFLRGVDEVHKDLIEARKYTSAFLFDFDLPTYDSLDYYKRIMTGIDLSNHFCIFYFWKLPTFEFLDLVVNVFKYVVINIDLCSLSGSHRGKLSSLKVVKPQPADEELFSFFDKCEEYDNIEVVINQIAGLPYFSSEDIKISEETLSRLLMSSSRIAAMDWGRLHAQPGAPIVNSCEKYDMHSYATTFEDFLHYSQLNLKEEKYPALFTFHYPYIYSKNDRLDSEISKFYVDANNKVKKYLEMKQGSLRGNHNITYKELHEKSDRLASVLKEKGVRADSIVGLMMKRSGGMVVGMLAILKAGGAYLPIDPDYPEERIQFMLEDSGVNVLVTTEGEKLRRSESKKNPEIVFPDFSTPPSSHPPFHPSQSSLAYVMYTSGSTGKPKGVMIEQQNVAALIKNSNYIDFEKEDRLLMTGAIVFDITTFEIWWPLLNGLNLYMVDGGVILDAEKLKNVVIENNITILHLIPQLFDQLAYQDHRIFANLRYFLVGGDLVRPRFINRIRNKYNDLTILHMYGPTENTTFTTFFPVDSDYESTIPIGKPIANSTVYIIDRFDGLVPIGVPGELLVGGESTARGYLNQPELTAEKFGRDLWDYQDYYDGYHRSYRSYISKRIYKSGDLARWLPDGNIEFLGRLDQQVKIRGFRIELGEIENRLLEHDEIKEIVVVLKTGEHDDKYLCAYFVPKGSHPGNPGYSIKESELREYLLSGLPGYMVPSYFVPMDTLPLTTNGKIDRKALPIPDIDTGDNYEAPRDRIENKLADIWSGVLGIEKEKIGINDNFFHLGGHSLKATLLVSRIHKELKVNVPLSEIFKTSHIRGLAAFIKNEETQRFFSIEAVEKREYYILSSAQRRLLVLQQMDETGIAYNITSAWYAEGDLDVERVNGVFHRLIRRHESLRTSFKSIAEKPIQVIHAPGDINFSIEYFSLEPGERENRPVVSRDDPGRCPGEVDEMIKNFVKPFDLAQAPLIRVGLINTGDHKYILIVDIHHIIFDGASLSVVVKDFKRIYQGKELPSLKLQYKDFSRWQTMQLKSERIEKQEEYWLAEFKEDIPELNLPTDYTRPQVQSFAGKYMQFEIGAEESGTLKELAHQERITIFMVLLAIYYILLAKLSGQDEIVIGTPTAGRKHTDLEKITGMFVNTLALKIRAGGVITFNDLLHQIKEKVLAAFENQDYQFESLVEKIALNRDMRRNPIFDVMFILQNVDIMEIDIPGIKLKSYGHKNLTAKFDLYFTAQEEKGKLAFLVEYNSKLFKEETIARAVFTFKNLVTTVINHPGIMLSELKRFPEGTNKELLTYFNVDDLENEQPRGSIQRETVCRE